MPMLANTRVLIFIALTLTDADPHAFISKPASMRAQPHARSSLLTCVLVPERTYERDACTYFHACMQAQTQPYRPLAAGIKR